uniref:Uncharacterized protein n=1 Tax=Stegastes partitus TaxID=144197 RepID=A0A3B5B5B7_9TELE
MLHGENIPLISAASSGKLRLVRLLVEGGAQVNGHNPSGETPLLAACKALRGEPAGPDSLRLLTYLLQNKADPNAQDRAGRTALMYACMERAGAQVASALLAAGADPSMEDHSGASALVYAINAQHQPTLKVKQKTPDSTRLRKSSHLPPSVGVRRGDHDSRWRTDKQYIREQFWRSRSRGTCREDKTQTTKTQS